MVISTSKDPRTVAIKAATEGGEVLLKYFKRGTYSRYAKADTSFQTAADLEAEHVILKHIQGAFPEHNIISEECGQLPSTSSVYRWMVDPLDGTENFLLGIPYFSSSIAFCENGVPIFAVVFNPITNQLYQAERGKGASLNDEKLCVSDTTLLRNSRVFFIPDFQTKREKQAIQLRDGLYKHCRRVLDTWSPALDWCLVASGKADLLITVTATAMEPEAGIGSLFIEEAGGKITDFHGHPLDRQTSKCLVVSNHTELHGKLLDLIKECDAYGDDEERFD